MVISGRWWYDDGKNRLKKHEHDPTLRSIRILTDENLSILPNILIFAHLVVLYLLHLINLAYSIKCRNSLKNFM